MKAVKITQINQVEIVHLPDPTPAADEVLVRVMASGICGTDIHILRGEYMGTYPVIPGHEFAGVVERVGEKVTRFKPGDRVAVEPNIACDSCFHCLNNRQNFCENWQAVGVTRPGAMAQLVAAPEKAVFSIGDMPFELGAFVEPLSCVLHGVQRLTPEMGSRMLVLGAGPIGLLLLQTLRLQGAASVTVVDRYEARAEAAFSFGADEVLTDLNDLTPDAYDGVVDATGSVAVMERTLEWVRPGGKVLLFGVPPAGKKMNLEAFQIFRKGLTVLSSFTSVRNSYQAIALLHSHQIEVEPLISHRLKLEEFEHGIHLIEQGLEDVRKVQILPNA